MVKMGYAIDLNKTGPQIPSNWTVKGNEPHVIASAEKDAHNAENN